MPTLPDIESVGRVSPLSQRAPVVRGPQDTSGRSLEVVGAQVGSEADQQLAQVTAAQKRIQSGEEAVQRARALAGFNQTLQTEFQRLSTEDDLTDPSTLAAFGKFQSEAFEAAASGHVGSEESRLRLKASLEGVKSRFTGQLATEANSQRTALLADVRNSQIATVVNSVSQAPDTILDSLRIADAIVDDQAGALTSDQERDSRLAARSAVSKAAVTSMLSQGTPESVAAAEELLAVPGVVEALGGDEVRTVRNKIIAARSSQNKGVREAQQKLEYASTITGIPPEQFTPEMRMRLAGLAPPKSRTTLADKVSDYEKVTGQPATPDVINQLAGLDGEDATPFGKGLSGRVAARLADDADAFGAGLLDPQEERRFIQAVTVAQQPITFQNPDTNVLETRRPELAPFVRDVLIARGRQDLIATTQTSVEERAQDRLLDPSAPDPTPQETVFGLSGLLTGPLAAAARIGQATPIVGNFMDTGEFTQAKAKVELLQRDLVRVLQNNPRFAEGERQSIANEIDITGNVFDTQVAFENRLIGIDDALLIRQQSAFDSAGNPNIGRSERQHALNVFNAITKFRQQLGVPPLAKTPQDVEKLQPGQLFRTPDGRVLRNELKE